MVEKGQKIFEALCMNGIGRKAPMSGRYQPIRKAPTGVTGLDEITEGGLPAGRPTLICGSVGCGKTMLAVEFLVISTAKKVMAFRH